jgi:hypothetical protein
LGKELPNTHQTGCWIDPSAGQDAVEESNISWHCGVLIFILHPNIILGVMLEMHAEMHEGFHLKFPLLLFNFNQNHDVLTNFRKPVHMKFQDNSFSSSQVVMYGWTGTAKATHF